MYRCRPSRRQFEVLDDRFAAARATSALERLYTGCRWAEGPAYFPAGRYLVWSDIPNDRMLRWDETTGAVGVFRHPSGYTNGHTLDRRGPPGLVRARRPPCLAHRARRLDHRRSPTGIDGKRLNSPNDVVVASDGSIWFTDPALRHRQRLRGPPGRERDRRLPRVPHRPGRPARAASSPTTSCARTAWRSRSTSGTLYIADTRRRATSAAFAVGDDGAPDRRGGLRRAARRRLRRHPPRRRRAASGPRPATACTASRPTAP